MSGTQPTIYFLWDFEYWRRRDRRDCGASLPEEVNCLDSHGYWELVQELKDKNVILMSTSMGAGLTKTILKENGCQVRSHPWNNQAALEAHLQEHADVFLIDYWEQAAGADLVKEFVEKLKLIPTSPT